ncbi:hypothetical protein [Streptomyces jumonjinensis]|uniref:Uncharacterized protein n=1 Tax=Streptomyces jumonjinensis TaxID=1945 RepID=A0A646KL61_STRJU|nr:hypothetical protein [Streptomyces jumonjinensis]MQT02757.1 hypothetical protein [Streptomyces jumonjinensis]
MDGPAPAPGGFDPADPVGYEAAVEAVGGVIAWYSSRILAERRAGATPEVLRELTLQRQACVKDRDRLEDADSQETARLFTLYTARLKELKERGSPAS